jgi:hypothetical protein
VLLSQAVSFSFILFCLDFGGDAWDGQISVWLRSATGPVKRRNIECLVFDALFRFWECSMSLNSIFTDVQTQRNIPLLAAKSILISCLVTIRALISAAYLVFHLAKY